MHFPLERCHVLLGQRHSGKEVVVRLIGETMLAAGEVTQRYVDGMLEKERDHSTWVMEGVALPHGTKSVKREVLHNSIVLVQLPGGVDWGGGKTVRLAIGFAGKGDDQHLKVLAALAGVLQDRESVERLHRATGVEEVLRILAACEEQPE